MTAVPRLWRVAAWTIVATTVAMIATVVALAVGAPEDLEWVGQASWLTLLTPLASVVVGAAVVDRRGSHPVGWLFCGAGLCWAVYHLGVAAGAYALNGQTVVAQDVLVWATSWSVYLEFALAPVLLIYVFPTGTLTSPRWRPAFGLSLVAIALGLVGNAFAPGPLEDIPQLDNPYGAAGGIGAILTVLRELAWPLLLLATLGAVLSLRARARGATFSERQQIKWLLWAGVVLFGFVCFWGLMELIGRDDIAIAIAGLFLPLLPAALGTAILRHRLYDIDILINRTLVYATVSAVLAAIYLAAVVLFGRLLAPLTADSNLAIAGSTLAVAALFRPLRERVQAFINRRFYRQKYDAAATLGRFSHRLRDELDLDALHLELLAAVDQTMQPVHAGLWLKPTEGMR